ncbi:MAG: patatin-like phospholipase family protein, partial [Muribaculaceae bacterium]|nr:patatin-like phospholipase family protein [Muribaculaceae bacterium]
IPTVICATDFDHGKSVGWGKGEIVPRVLASCSIPIIFQPIRINGVNYVDGGVLRNLPAWAIRDYCTILYGLDCSPMRKTYHYKPSVIDIAYRSYHLMTKANTLQDIRLCDYVITTENLTDVKTFDLSSLQRGVSVGYEIGCRVLDKIMNKRK